MRLISRHKIEAIMDRLKQERIDAAIFLSREPLLDSNIAYLSGFSGMLNGILVLTRKGNVQLLTTELDYDRALAEAGVDEVVKISAKIKASDVIRPLMSGAKRIGVVKNRFTVGAMRKLRLPASRLVDIEGIMLEARAVKEEKEILAMRHCARISNHGIRFLHESLRKGMRENEVSAELERVLKSKGSERVPFDTIVTSGKRSFFVHPYPSASNKRIGPGLGLVDFGAVCQGYVTDVTVPFLAGNGTAKERKIIEAVQSTFDNVVHQVRDGVSVKALNTAYENGVGKGGFKVKHSLGHGLGLDTHDSPSLTEPSGVLRAGMTLTLEPGVYVRGIGGVRIENDVLVNKSGCEMLTESKLIRI